MLYRTFEQFKTGSLTHHVSSGTLMVDPVLLPTSKVVVDRSVIAKHLLSDPIDPFNRQPLAMVDVVPQVQLKEEIAAWTLEQLADIRSAPGHPSNTDV